MTYQELNKMLDAIDILADQSHELYAFALREMYQTLRDKQDKIAGQLADVTAQLSQINAEISRVTESIERELGA